MESDKKAQSAIKMNKEFSFNIECESVFSQTVILKNQGSPSNEIPSVFSKKFENNMSAILDKDEVLSKGNKE